MQETAQERTEPCMFSDALTPPENATIPLTIDDVRARFEAWRAIKPYANSPIPGELWDLALDLLDRHGVVEIARGLRLDPKIFGERARRRRASRQLTPPSTQSSSAVPELPPFVEVTLSPAGSIAMSPSGAAGTPCHKPRQILEIRFPDGTIVSATHAEPMDVTPLFRALFADHRR